jgi:hypothetical protein
MSEEDENDFTPLTLAELGEVIQGSSHALGESAGLSSAAEYVRAMSGTYFSQENDAAAEVCRKLAQELEHRAKTKRKYFNDSCDPRETAVFAELVKREQLMLEVKRLNDGG